MPVCWHCKAETPASHFERVVHNHTALHAQWDGWRMAGRFLIAPGPAGRITPERLLGMLWEEKARRSTLAKNSPDWRSPPAINDLGGKILPARELFRGQA